MALTTDTSTVTSVGTHDQVPATGHEWMNEGVPSYAAHVIETSQEDQRLVWADPQQGHPVYRVHGQGKVPPPPHRKRKKIRDSNR